MSNYLNNQGNEYLITNITDADIIQELRYVLNIALLIHEENYNFLQNVFVKGIFPLSFGTAEWRNIGN